MRLIEFLALVAVAAMFWFAIGASRPIRQSE